LRKEENKTEFDRLKQIVDEEEWGGYDPFKRDGIKECSLEQLKKKRIELFERLMHGCLLHTA
jgi:hypothetical protein